MPFIRLNKFLSILGFLSVFLMNGCWILSNAFSVSTEMIMNFSFILLIYCVTWIDFHC